MRLHAVSKLSAGMAGCLLIALTMSRCSPLSPSFSKYDYLKDQSDRGSESRPETPIEVALKAKRFSTQLLADGELQAVIDRLPPGSEIVRLDEVQVTEFRETGKTIIKASSERKLQITHGLFELGTTSNKESMFALIPSFSANLEPMKEGGWTLSAASTDELRLIDEVALIGTSLEERTIPVDGAIKPAIGPAEDL